ncbi:MAG: hypothetical protein U1F23_08085 [Lysobacterales bacterium]
MLGKRAAQAKPRQGGFWSSLMTFCAGIWLGDKLNGQKDKEPD